MARASHALTRFNPTDKGEMVTSHEGGLQGARWGVLFADLSEDDKNLFVRMEVPGLDPQDFDISVVDTTLVVRGEKRMAREDLRGRYHVTECAYGRFERAITLPESVRVDKASAKYRNGVLKITLPKTSPRKKRRLKIEEA